MKKKLFAILTTAFLITGITAVAYGGTVTPQSVELPNIH
jgi:hypothetical protein